MMNRMMTVALLVLTMSASYGAAQETTKRAPAKSAAVAGSTVNLNTASQTELEALPGVGARTAERIIEYRQKNGGFKKLEDLMNVQGVGEKNFLKLKPMLTLSAARAGGTAQ